MFFYLIVTSTDGELQSWFKDGEDKAEDFVNELLDEGVDIDNLLCFKSPSPLTISRATRNKASLS